MINNLSICIAVTTKNRKYELFKCISSCIKMSGIDEVLVMDDGSTDGTYDFIKDHFSTISLHRNLVSLGLINARTKCAHLTKCDIIVSVDDDCIFNDLSTLEEIIPYFSDDSIAAVTIPVIDVLKSNDVTQKGIGHLSQTYICSQYRGCGHAIRRSIFLELGGYRTDLVRQEEETDLAMRIYNSGYVIRVASCKSPILHYHSAVRNEELITFYQARNKLMIAYAHTPNLFLVPVMSRIYLTMTIYAANKGQLKSGLMGLLNATKSIAMGNVKRTKQSLKVFVFYKNLRRNYIQRVL
jgi:GT2 family glycosyltransferase